MEGMTQEGRKEGRKERKKKERTKGKKERKKVAGMFGWNWRYRGL
jgi:hypothetical protein